MLCQFSFQNFKSYQNKAVLDFQAAPIKEFSESLIKSEYGNDRFLPLAAVYGPNGGGKSGVIEALRACVDAVVGPKEFLSTQKDDYILRRREMMSHYNPFKFDHVSQSLPTCFELFFRMGLYEYRYTLSYDERSVVKESLHRRSLKGGAIALIFEREDSNVFLGSSVPAVAGKILPGARTPFLSVLSVAYDIPAVSDAMKWFESVRFVGSGIGVSPYDTQRFDILEKNKKSVEDVLSRIDLGITEMNIAPFGLDGEGAPQGKKIELLHEVSGEVFSLRETEESQGTRRILWLLPEVIESLQLGSVLVVDELDEKLHPKLLREIIMLYRSMRTNVAGGQLLFSSHDVCTMRSTVFRRDEIWFASRNEYDSSNLYSLYELRDTDGGPVKTTAAYDKQYMEGRYGADPYFGLMREWVAND